MGRLCPAHFPGLKAISLGHLAVPSSNVKQVPHLQTRGIFPRMIILYMGKMGSICHFSRALPASIWGRCSQVLVFTSTWGTQKGV